MVNFRLLVSSLIICLLAACTPSAQAIQTAIAQTQAVWTPTVIPSPTNIPPTDTPIPTVTLILAPTFTAIPATDTPEVIGEHYAWNYLATQESGGVNVQIARLLLADKSAINSDFSGGGLVTIFDNRPVVAEIIFIIENKTDKTISIYTDQGMVVAGGEQIKLLDFAMAQAEFGDDFSGDILPGAKVIGGIWIGFKRAKVPDIQQMTIIFDGPSNESFARLGPDFKFTLDLSSRQDTPIPDELK